MAFYLAFISLIAASISVARPLVPGPRYLASRELTNTLSNVTIHESCNATEHRQLTKALAETYEIAAVARDYVLQHGHSDELFKIYFGSAEPFAVIGAFEHLISGDKTGVLLRCDDIDGNCQEPLKYGHWRGDNATLETVICPLSYEIRKPLTQFCALGYTVIGSPPSFYFSTDLIHRFYHVPTIGNGLVGHHADSYAECLQLAIDDPSSAPFNTHTLQYFAADVYARVVANPREGCTGEAVEEASTTTVTSAAASATDSAHDHESASSSTTASAEASCHTHADGEVHCV